MWKCPPSTILVPVDFGEASARAMAVAAALATRLGARLQVLHAEAIETPPYFTLEQIDRIERERKAAKARAAQYLADFARQSGADRFDVEVLEGSPTASIVETARRADLVVMGTHGRRGPSRWWLGSVAERVVHESGTPVLVVRADLGGLHPGQVFDRPMVVSTPGGEGEAMRVASGLSSAFGGKVADKVATCQADLASQHHVTLMVVAKPAATRGATFGHPVEQWLRSCTLPMLFVPATVGV